MWGSNVPLTRTPDAHWMTEGALSRPEGHRRRAGLCREREVRRRVGDDRPGTDGAPGDGHGSRPAQEYFVDRSIDFFTDYNQRFTDVPF